MFFFFFFAAYVMYWQHYLPEIRKQNMVMPSGDLEFHFFLQSRKYMGIHACSPKRRDDLERKIKRDAQFWMLHLILI